MSNYHQPADSWIVPNDQASGISLEDCGQLRLHRQFYEFDKDRGDTKFFQSTAASLTKPQKKVN
jgi:hypothetical protein